MNTRVVNTKPISFRHRLRREVGAQFFRGMFNGLSRIATLHPHAKPEHHGVRVIRNVAYGPRNRNEHLLDVYLPKEARGPLPVVLYVHGGAFRILSKDSHFVMGIAYARRGYAVFNINYRLAPRHPYPAALEDACLAYEWLVHHAEGYGGDISRLVLAGESAGANLVTALTLATVYKRSEGFARAVFETGVVPRAVVPACGVFDITGAGDIVTRKPKMHPFIADRIRELQEIYLAGTPAHISRDFADPLVVLERGDVPSRPIPPFFLPVGTKDPLLNDTRRLARALRSLGATAVDTYYPGEVHAFHALVFRESAKKCWRDTFSFLKDHVQPHESNQDQLHL